MAVTHAPQVAPVRPAFVISKDALDRASASPPASTRFRQSPPREIARMLAGAEITAEGAAAERLLKAARREL